MRLGSDPKLRAFHGQINGGSSSGSGASGGMGEDGTGQVALGRTVAVQSAMG